MKIEKVVSYILGLSVGLLAVAPPIDYSVPLIVNSYSWLYMVVVTLLLNAYLLTQKFPLSLKILVGYLSVSCFVSMAPYLSFNALILVCVSAYAFWWFSKNDDSALIDMVVAAFCVQILFGLMQIFVTDRLMNFDRQDSVFLGSVMQYMRFGSLLAIMTPLLVLKNKWFILPILGAVIISKSSSFALAVFSGTAVYVMLKYPKIRWWVPGVMFVCSAGYLWYDRGSVITELGCGRIPVWADIIRTWVMNTSHKFTLPLAGPVDWKSIFFGRGMDTFMPLFPIFKHDMNPFAQAHNCHLQIVWELGAVGYCIFVAYFINLFRRLRNYPLLIAGLVCMLVNMFFAFPTRMTQTMFMMVAFMGVCERLASEGETNAR